MPPGLWTSAKYGRVVTLSPGTYVAHGRPATSIRKRPGSEWKRTSGAAAVQSAIGARSHATTGTSSQRVRYGSRYILDSLRDGPVAFAVRAPSEPARLVIADDLF